MSNIIDLKSRLFEKHQESLSPYQRVHECLHHVLTTQKDECKYCSYRSLTSRMIFEILVKDMISASKTRHLKLTNIDLELIIQELFMHVDDINERMHLGKEMGPPKESTKKDLRSNSRFTRRESPITQRNPTVTQDAKQDGPTGRDSDGGDDGGGDGGGAA